MVPNPSDMAFFSTIPKTIPIRDSDQVRYAYREKYKCQFREEYDCRLSEKYLIGAEVSEVICFERMELDLSCCAEDLSPFLPG